MQVGNTNEGHWCGTENKAALTLGMGCFWGPEALFGSLPGVLRTSTGYAGGSAPAPTYKQMGDHSEMVEVEYDPAVIALDELLNVFWSHHKPVNINGYKGLQYRSLLLYRDEEQRRAMLKIKALREREIGELATDIQPYEHFYRAEDKHQKYYLKRYPDAVAKLEQLYPSPGKMIDSTLAARLNGIAKGYSGMERLRSEISGWPLEPAVRNMVLRQLGQIRW
ncbi:peptide-methionine (S)-S-oxide reductase MsrA [Paenibacillus tarimensis]|uniref:peptide-methionine (S)-S-oxide reductase MsrA n=1 Tax=Paenibacillus tarimensis TaxID=416012 RepID=UPI001F2743D2|nr:peptide-methionine (S)-S-oxide reductase MsrA [Paenibacillus tarimensis]MCF2945125.1 peptide-methionine (S)-S-oxide reductase MsrA [Paenibacillus tarimensis]